jgi:hypothetical protein
MSKFSLKLLDNEKNLNNNLGNYQRGIDMGKKALTETDIAALAAGLPIEAAAETEEIVEASADPVIEGEGAAVEPTAEVTEPENEKQEPQASVVSFLQSQVKEKDAEILNLSIELKGIKDKVASMEATHNGLTDVVRKAVAGMKVRLGASNVDLSALSAQELLADYAATAESFLKNFKAGGVAAVDAAENVKTVPQSNPRDLARTRAAKFSK